MSRGIQREPVAEQDQHGQGGERDQPAPEPLHADARRLRKDRQQGPEREHDAADPDPAHETIDLELDGRLRAVAREVTEDDVDVLLEPEPVVDIGDGRLLLRVELLGGHQHAERAPFVTVNVPTTLK